MWYPNPDSCHSSDTDCGRDHRADGEACPERVKCGSFARMAELCQGKYGDGRARAGERDSLLDCAGPHERKGAVRYAGEKNLLCLIKEKRQAGMQG